MSLFGRAKLLFKVSVGAIMAPAEDPRESFTSAHERQGELLAKVTAARVHLTASKEGLAARARELRASLPALEEQARTAVIGGQENQARMALRRRRVAESQLSVLEEQHRDVEREEHGLGLIEQRLTTQIESFAMRQEVIAASYKAAEAQVRINEALAGVSGEIDDLGLALEVAERSADGMRARASAIEELAANGVLELQSGAPSDLEREVDRDLAEMVEGLRGALPGAGAE